MWVPLLTEAMGQPLVGRLVARGLRVESSMAEGLCEDRLLCLFVGIVENREDDVDVVKHLHDLVRNTLNDLGASHHGVIVVEQDPRVGMWWSGEHIQEPPPSPPESLPTAFDILMEDEDS